MKRIVKMALASICGVIAATLAAIGGYLLLDYRAYHNAEITTALIHDGEYDPSEHFRFDRACVFPPESALADTWFSQRGYRQIDPIFPDTYTNWTVVLVDDQRRTFRTLYVLQPRVGFGGKIVCNPKITLRTRGTSGNLVAYVEETGANQD